MPTLELKTEEATFIYDMTRDCHFIIDCACGGKDGKYSGSHYKDNEEVLGPERKKYQPLMANKYEHTFYLSQVLLIHTFENRVNEGKPVIIVCNDCSREFPFTRESYWDLIERMEQEYSRRIREARKID